MNPASSRPSDEIEVEIQRLVQLEKGYRTHNYTGEVPSNDALNHNEKLLTLVHECASIIDASTASSSYSAKIKRELSVNSLTDVGRVSKQQPDQKPVDDSQSMAYWRQQMMDWAIMVVDSFGADRDLVCMGFNVLDRFVILDQQKTRTKMTRDDFQLYCMTCLYIVIKVMESYPRKLSVQSLVEMSRGFYSQEDILSAEMEILMTVQWKIHPPTSMHFANLFFEYQNLPMSITTQQSIGSMIEFAISEPIFLSMSISSIGLAASLVTLHLQGRELDLKSLRAALFHVVNPKEVDHACILLEELYCR